MSNFIALKRLLICACITAHVAICEKNVTIHTRGGSNAWKSSAETWPCLEYLEFEREATFNNYGCYLAHIPHSPDAVVWSIPEGEGPIRLAMYPHLCLDAGSAIASLERDGTPNHTTRVSLLLQRVITLQPCSGHMSQQFLVEYTLGHIKLASRPEWSLKAEYAALTLDSSHGLDYRFVFAEFSDPDALLVFGSAANHHKIILGVNIVKYICLGVYIIINLKRLCRLRFKSIVDAVKLACSTWRKPRNLKVRALVAQRRVRRAAYTLRYGAHLSAVWMAYRTSRHWSDFVATNHNHRWMLRLTDSEVVPMIALSIMCVLCEVRPVRSAMTLDVLTCGVSALWAFQYYLMAQNLGGTNVEMYLFNESWMLILRTCVNLALGRVAVVVPCTVGVTIVDVYCKYYLATLHNQYDHITKYYLVKQCLVCGLVCSLQFCLERLSYGEVEASLDSRQARMYEKLATRLTTSVYDAVAHLDCRLNFSQPAPKLGSILLRSHLGVYQMDFLHLVVPEDHSRLKQYLDTVASADEHEPLMPIRMNLLDATNACVRVQMFASAFCDDDDVLHYILGIGEVEDVERAGAVNEVRMMPEPQAIGISSSISIPEKFRVVSDTEEDRSSEASSVSDSDTEFDQRAFDVSICQTTGNILSVEENFGAFMNAEIVGSFFPALFHDPPAVWAWLRMQIERIGAEQTFSERELTSGTFVILRRGRRFNANIRCRGLGPHDDGSSCLDLKVRILKSHKARAPKRLRKVAKRSREASSESTDISLVLQASGNDHFDVMDKVLASAELFYASLLAERYARFQHFWNTCTMEMMESVEFPIRRSQDSVHLEVKCERFDHFVCALSLRMYKGTPCYLRLCRALSLPFEERSSPELSL
eukprot:TRINITY_DN3077_c0_g1_i9.p1 TRINITY_DN3077_c0_g1~~TRINITY_DN3077_c0_g1_i9.p1  ORF type:complete len:884 (-),score=38.48 TRINITY_DN3077_c0_g1_i9:106-2727(-)